MAHGRQEDPRGDHYSGGTYPRSADASQRRLSENEHVDGPPQSTVSIHDGPVVVLTTHVTCLKGPAIFTVLGLCSLERPAAASRRSRTVLCGAMCQW